MQEGHGALRMRGRREDRPLVLGQHLEPGIEIAGMIRPRLELRCDAEIGTEEAASQLGDEFLAGALAPVLAVAAEIAVQAMLCPDPMGFMPISA